MSEATVLVPGLLCSAEVFAGQVPALWTFGPVTVANTLDGDTVETIAASILRTSPPGFALAGISFGGYLALEIMRQAPQRVRRLALLSTSARPDAADQPERRRAMLAAARASDYGPWVEEALTSIMHPSRHADPALRAINRRMGLAVGLDGFARQTEAAIARPDSRPDLAAIRVPTLVLVGAEDALIPPDNSRELAANISGATLVEVPQCGHSSALEQPEAVASALVAWMKRTK